MRFFLFGCLCYFGCAVNAQDFRLIEVDSAWANNSINTVVFRKNSLVSFRDTQYIAFYDKNGLVTLGKRRLGENDWQLRKTPWNGRMNDAHNSISIMVDGAGYLHLAWDHHNDPLNYVRSIKPGSLILGTKEAMTHKHEMRVTYPEFFRLPDGDLLFFYRDGESGRGNLVINRYNLKTQTWTQLHHNLIDGEAQRSAYWQACVDARGRIHVSWVWRETWDVSSNHDMAYARSEDGGISWEKSSGEKYQIPITASTAEYACRIPEKRELINQTSMFADETGQPFIASYWREEGASVPQFHLVYKKGEEWAVQNLGFRNTPFSLSGGGTKRIPISRPQIVSWNQGKKQQVAVIFRDEERGNKVSIAINRNIRKKQWTVKDLWSGDLGLWEPSFDTELWKDREQLHLFLQKVEQLDSEGLAHTKAEMVRVLEWKRGQKDE